VPRARRLQLTPQSVDPGREKANRVTLGSGSVRNKVAAPGSCVRDFQVKARRVVQSLNGSTPRQSIQVLHFLVPHSRTDNL